MIDKGLGLMILGLSGFFVVLLLLLYLGISTTNKMTLLFSMFGFMFLAAIIGMLIGDS